MHDAFTCQKDVRLVALLRVWSFAEHTHLACSVCFCLSRCFHVGLPSVTLFDSVVGKIWQFASVATPMLKCH